MIKPLTQTPPHSNTVPLSLLDQLVGGAYIPIILFYQSDTNSNHPLNNSTTIERSILLKKSLSETLVDFYPLAGRIQRNEFIDCNDDGVEFCEAHTSENLTQFTQNPILGDLVQLIPFRDPPLRQTNPPLVSIQVNHFACGGMAIAACISHKVADGEASVKFLKAWATKTSQQDQEDHHVDSVKSCPRFDGASIFPPLKELNEVVLEVSMENVSMRRVVFDKKAIDELKAQAVAGNDSITTRPTSVQVVTAFIWKHLPEVSTVMHLVNLRSRMVPPISKDSFGNFAWLARASLKTVVDQTDHQEQNCGLMVQELHKAISKINNDYMSEYLFSDNFLLRVQSETEDLLNGSGKCVPFSSLCRFPLYEVNFGMGNPVWACISWPPAVKGVHMWNTKCGQGIEAWIYMNEDEFAMLDNQLSDYLISLTN